MKFPDTAARQSNPLNDIHDAAPTARDARAEDRLLRQREVQKICGGVDRGTIFRWRRLGLIPAPRMIAGRPYWKASDIARFVAGTDASK